MGITLNSAPKLQTAIRRESTPVSWEVGGDFADSASPVESFVPTTRGAHIAAPHTDGNPLIGGNDTAPQLIPGETKSPEFLATEEKYFRELDRLVKSARPGDIVAFQMYEFENAATNGDKSAAKDAPGYVDQQAILNNLCEAADRGVHVEGILDASKNPSTGELMNAPVANYLIQHGKKNGNITLDYYPANTVHIDHAKEALLLRKNGNSFAVEEALVGGSNWGNHTPANDDGGAVFSGKDAMGAAQIFFRDQAFSRGDTTSAPLPSQDPSSPVQWAVTSPRQEGGGSQSIKEAKMALIQQADSIYLNEFCLNNKDLVAELVGKGAAVHARLDPNELGVNKDALAQIREAGGEAMWANTAMDPKMAGQKNHEKLDVYLKNGNAFAASLGSANDTGSGLEMYMTGTSSEGKPTGRVTNHEIDAIVSRYTSPDGSYSTAKFLDDALAKNLEDLKSKSLEKPPHGLSGTTPGHF